MKKKVLKIIAFIIAIALILGICWVANGLNGNPISKMLAKKAANEYLEANFPDTDYYIEELGFSFKFTGYYAHVRSESSMDTQFTLEIDMIGNVFYDTYDDVLSGAITARRLEQDYRTLTDQIFENPAFPYSTNIGYGRLEIYPQGNFRWPLYFFLCTMNATASPAVASTPAKRTRPRLFFSSYRTYLKNSDISTSSL